MVDLSSLTYEQLEQYTDGLKVPKFRAKQIYRWISRGIFDFEDMTDLPKSFRQQLQQTCMLACLKVRRRLVDPDDQTVKYVFELSDGLLIETVVMHYKHGNSVCISSQAGCRMGCRFCASTLKGKQRDLSAGEMLAQVAYANAELGVGHIVVMGVGEPLDNYDSLLVFLRNVNHPDGLNISQRHISVSTCGLVDKIRQLADEKLQITLSVSLHAPDNETRNRLMPVNQRWPIEELIDACRYYIQKTGRRISFEYTLVKDVNDRLSHAQKLYELLAGMLAHVNLIPVNYVQERGLYPSDKNTVRQFYEYLDHKGMNVTVRRTLGGNIDASCGQLRLMEEQDEAVR